MTSTRDITLKFVATAVTLSLGSVVLAPTHAWANEPRQLQAQPIAAENGLSPELANKLISDLLKATEAGTKLNIEDENQIAKYVLSLFAVGVGYVPVFGPSLSALTNLLGTALFPSGGQSVDALWQKLSDRVGEMIDSKIADYDAKTLRASLVGINANLQDYNKAVIDFAKAPEGERRDQAAERIRTLHRAFLVSVQQEIPQFQKDDYAVASLPLFAAAANVHLALLTDGVEQGEKWGFSQNEVKDLRDNLKNLTTPGGDAKKGVESVSDKLNTLNDAIEKGHELGASEKSVDTWRNQVKELEKEGEPQAGDASADYVSYVNKVYAEGRKKVKASKPNISDKGGPEANERKALADYDTAMNLNVLDYAKLWPYLADKIPDSAKAGLDREIFYGPYGRGTDSVPWDASNPPAAEQRGAAITGVRVWGWDDVDAIQIKYGNEWGPKMGGTGGALRELTLDKGEYITKVEGVYGQKLGKIKFTTNKGNSVENGAARHVNTLDGKPGTFSVAPDAQALTSVRITQFSAAQPPGTEGVVLGFRSLLTDQG